MNCTDVRHAISASIDGEELLPPSFVEEHLHGCAACRSWRDRVHAVTRAVRLAPAEPVPDLVEPIVASYVATLASRSPRRMPAMPGWRVGLVAVALLQLAVALPGLLFGSEHVAREMGSWDVALAVGFLFAAFSPQRVAGLLPVVAALVGCHLLASGFDVAAGRTAMVSEAPHMLSLAGLFLLTSMRTARA